MSVFSAVDASSGFGPSRQGIDLVLDVGSIRQQHAGSLMVVRGPLATESAIDSAIDELKRELDTLRATAKEKLKSSVDSARGTR